MTDRGSRQVAWRWVAVVAGLTYVSLLAAVAFLVRTETSESVTGSSSDDGAYTSELTTTTAQTLWQTQGTPIAVIVGVLTAVVLVGAASLAWRVGRGSSRPGITALVTAGLLALLALLALLSVGLFLLPLVGLLVYVGLPLSAFAPDRIQAQ